MIFRNNKNSYCFGSKDINVPRKILQINVYKIACYIKTTLINN
jgi:hypothetical protein